jgi:hypothetical protein
MRARLLFVMVAGGCAVTAATACSSPDVAVEAQAKKATQASSVSIQILDIKGTTVGSFSGTLIARNLVLTAGHCAAGAARWKIDSRGASTTAEATHAVSPWKSFGSDLSHPDHADIAVLLLDTPIELDAYPKVADSMLADGAKAVRFSRSSANATKPEGTDISVASMSGQGFRLDYGAKVAKGTYVDTGGAIIDPSSGKIHGVVSGMGKTSGLLHIARTDNFSTWLSGALACSGKTVASTGISTRTYGGSSSSSSSSSSSGYGGGGGSSGWPGGGGGDWGGYGGSGDTIDGGGATPGSSSGTSGTGGGTTGSSSGSSGGGTSGSSGASGGTSGAGGSSGSSGTGGTAGAGGGGIDTSGTGSACPGVPSCDGSDCPGDDGAPGTSKGSNGGANPGGSSGSSGTSGNTGATGGTTSGGTSSGGSAEVCPGPPNCPEPDSQACVGAACGGCAGVAGCADATIDYGACATCGSSPGTGTDPVVR